ncbi:MAG: alcohol dehydrogenase catalytic domain-containing protein [Dehalococcoidia bacterium]
MRTAILTAPLTIAIEERPAPEPDPGEVLVAVRRSGVCGTDVHAFLGRLGSAGRVLGHDFVGEIRAIGAGVDGRTVGERVTVEPARVCGKCPPCRAGAPNVCERKQFMGVDIDGCFQDLLVAPAGSIRPLPDELSDDEATVLEPVAVALHVFGECLPLRRGNETVVLIGAGRSVWLPSNMPPDWDIARWRWTSFRSG